MSDQNNKPVAMLCRGCGSLSVMRDAWAVWDVELQEWVLGRVFDAAYCEACESETVINEVLIEEERP